ncbi:MAG: carbamoyl-phosphate synthase (glutamine-hydrolyzing) large subunit [Patescibacteria group bacterium]|jgi:carbamoyl-phosphate synthase large subunit
MSKHPLTILLLGSGALKIGQAGEFDYSGSQAIKAIKACGYRVVLINPNVATIQTSDSLADEVYFLPVDAYFAEKVITAERPYGIMLGFGGQTALNCGLELDRRGVLKKYSVKVLGTPIKSIRLTEDRELFANFMVRNGFCVPRSKAVTSVKAAQSAAKRIGYPVMIRSGFSLGGLGSGIVQTPSELIAIATAALAHAPQILIEECLRGWKEVEYEVVRDSSGNCCTICNMENLDPLGIHTGDSIVVAPSQTLNNREYHSLRSISINVIKKLGIIGECNIQFALDPISDKYRIIEVNARLSRSSALASKATGYPLAAVAAQLALGKQLTEIRNAVTKKTPAFFEPALDYIVLKFPRWDFSKFLHADLSIGSQMKSVGEVMAIGRSFPEVLQKAIRMLDIGRDSILDKNPDPVALADAAKPTPQRIFYLAAALYHGISPAVLSKRTGIDRWFLSQIQDITKLQKQLQSSLFNQFNKSTLLEAKQFGFSDCLLGKLCGMSSDQIRAKRKQFDVLPYVKRIDTVAAEFPAQTNYLYCTYHATASDRLPDKRKSAVVIGSGVYRIGSSVEFDWCAVNAAAELHRQGFSSIMINCNPETVSTDYDVSDALYFEELTLERVLDICDHENPEGAVVSVGGQVANNLALGLAKRRINLLGTSAKAIDNAEDRHKFSKLLDRLGIKQPAWTEATTAVATESFAERVGFPVIIRPSYVLSGSAMNVATNMNQLRLFLRDAALVSPEHPVVVSKFEIDAHEIDVDAVAQNGRILTAIVSEHVENAGVHSGDATLVLPPQKVYIETYQQIKEAVNKIAAELQITGPCNFQFLARDNQIKVIECNLRASRSFPFASKVTNINLIKLSIQAMVLRQVAPHPVPRLPYVAVKAPQFSFHRLTGTDPILRVEMASTGEVASFGRDVYEAFLKSVLATGFRLPRRSILLSLGGEHNKMKLLDEIQSLANRGFYLFATENTHEFLTARGIASKLLHKIHITKEPNIRSYLQQHKIELVINLAHQFEGEVIRDDYVMRRLAIDFNVPLITNLQLAQLFLRAIQCKNLDDLQAKPWSAYRPLVNAKKL